MIKIKKQSFAFLTALSLLTVFFWNFDSRINLAKADCDSTYNSCYESASTELEEDSCWVAYQSCTANDASYECGYGMVRGTNGTCIADRSGGGECPSGLMDEDNYCYSNLAAYCDAVTDAAKCGSSCGDHAYLAVDNTCECEAGYSRTGGRSGACYPDQTSGVISATTNNENVGGNDFNACMAENNGLDYCVKNFDDGSHCSSNAECINDGAGNYCDMTVRLCDDRNSNSEVNTSNGDICYTDSECNWYSTCKLGTNGATGVCQGYLNTSNPQSQINNLLGSSNLTQISSPIVVSPNRTITADSTYNPATRTITSPTGVITRLTADEAAILAASGGLRPIIAGTSTAKCGVGFDDIGGVCFPGQNITGNMSRVPILVILSSLLSWLFGIFTTLAIAAFVFSGIQYLLSAGEPSLADSAKKNATNAIIGIVVGLSGFVVIQAISSALGGSSIF